MNEDFQYPVGVRNELKRRSLEKYGILLCGICGLEVKDNGKYGKGATMNLDHILPKSRGGSFAIDNIQLAHVSCNTKKACGSRTTRDEPLRDVIKRMQDNGVKFLGLETKAM